MCIFLGLDGGGTKTASVIMDETGSVLGCGLGGPCNIANYDDDAVRPSLRDAVTSALQDAGLPLQTRFTAVSACVAGYIVKARRAQFSQLIEQQIAADRHLVEPDYVGAFWGATDGNPGVVVIAGTGSVVYGRNADGDVCKVGGEGWFLDDQGSGFWVGERALRRVMELSTDRATHNAFAQAIYAHTGAQDRDDIVAWAHIDFSPARIAGLVSVVAELARNGDEQAISLFEAAANLLGAKAIKAFEQLGIPPLNGHCYVIGGLWQAYAPMRSSMASRLARSAATVHQFRHIDSFIETVDVDAVIRLPLHDPAYGAALLAKRECER